jgi:hypothetical protein
MGAARLHILSMGRLLIILGLAAAAGILLPPPAHARDPYSIMAPEPWLAPKYQTPKELRRPARSKGAKAPKTQREFVRTAPLPPPPVYIPGTGAIPNLPPTSRGYVPGGGTESYSDRVARCAHQSGLYGVPGIQAGSYIHNCSM